MQDFTKEYNLLDSFCIKGDVVEISLYGEGHINVTMLVVTTKAKYILQKINTVVFKAPEDVMHNILLVTEFIKNKEKLSLTIVKTKDGKAMLRLGDDCYRVYDFIDKSVTYQQAKNEQIFKNAGYAFGEFQNWLADFDATQLNETITNFHNTPHRYEDFSESVKNNASGRLELCKKEVEFVTERRYTLSKITNALATGEIPVRVTHNDTKLNNILMDPNTGKAKAVIDLDTVMPGSMLYDFGDAIRFGASTAAEDERNLDKVNFDINLFKAYAEGFCRALNGHITENERNLLPYSAYLMTIECGMRFLADFIDGDIYFATKYSDHNLIRCRTQLKLAKQMQEREAEMLEIVKKL